MRTTSAFVSGMATMGILAGGIAWGTGFASTATTDTKAQSGTDSTSSNSSSSSDGSTTDSSSSSTSNSSSSSSSSSSGAKDGTYDGDVVQTRYGPMQIEVVIKNGKIDSATALQNPGGDRTSDQINAQVIPMLNDAIVKYQTLNFGNVSRATISTNGYKQSAQSALDKAGFTG
ncbi:MAG: hypothetical protein RLZZ40_506 [Actinomycetota bacterium]